MSFIQFHSDNHTEVLRLSKDGIWANPDIPADDAAKLVLAALELNIKALIDKAVKAERDACAGECDEWIKNGSTLAEDIAAAIRVRGNT